MKAAITTQYGSPEVIQIQEVPKPKIKPNELLIRVKASAVNSGDVRIRALNGGGVPPFVMRLIFGWKKPKSGIQGFMYSGVVEAIGANVMGYQIGDEVYGSTGMNMGAHAEYLKIKEGKTMVKKPKNASHEEAAAILFGGTTALYFLHKAGIERLKTPKVMIYGATGSVGTAALEIAKHFGAHVTAVCSHRGADLAKSLGADQIIDYTKEDFAQTKESYDIIFDAVGKIKKSQSKGILKPDGKYITVDSMDVAKESKAQMELLAELFEKGILHANIDKSYALDQAAEAHAYVDSERKKGNVVLNHD